MASLLLPHIVRHLLLMESLVFLLHVWVSPHFDVLCVIRNTGFLLLRKSAREQNECRFTTVRLRRLLRVHQHRCDEPVHDLSDRFEKAGVLIRIFEGVQFTRFDLRFRQRRSVGFVYLVFRSGRKFSFDSRVTRLRTFSKMFHTHFRNRLLRRVAELRHRRDI